jgi:hypothetical protein
MTYIGFYAVSPNKRLYLYREIHWYKTKIEEWAPIVKQFIDKENPKIIKFCQSAKQDRGLEHTVQQQIETALGRGIELTTNSAGSRVAGKMLLHEYLRWKIKPSVPDNEVISYSEDKALWILRNRGLDEYKSYLKLFDPPEPEDNLPKFQIFLCEADNHEGHTNCCPLMIDSIKACNYDKKSSDGKAAEDVAEFEGDDPYDDARYACDSAETYFTEAGEEFKRIQRESRYIELLQQNNDWTAFYRNMRQLHPEESTSKMTKLYHGNRR